MADVTFFVLMAMYLVAMTTCAYFLFSRLEELFDGKVRFSSNKTRLTLLLKPLWKVEFDDR